MSYNTKWRDDAERARLRVEIERDSGNMKAVARRLDVSYYTIIKKVKRLGLRAWVRSVKRKRRKGKC